MVYAYHKVCNKRATSKKFWVLRTTKSRTTPHPLGSCSQSTTFVGDFFLLRIPWYGKIHVQFQNWFFFNYPYKFIECKESQLDIFLCFYTYWRLLDLMEANTKCSSILTKSCGQALDPPNPTPQSGFWCAPPKTFFTSPLSMFVIYFLMRAHAQH